MTTRILISLAVALIIVAPPTFGQQSQHVTLFGGLNPNPVRYSGSWGWTSPEGAEYALLGGFAGTHIIAIDDSDNVYQADFIEGQPSNWREITVIGDFAYVVTEGGGDLQGMQVIDLSPLPDSVHLVTTYATTFTRGHIIMRDISTDSAIVYVSGTSTTGGVHMMDVSDPANPTQVGLYDPPYYVHDAHVRGDILFASALGSGLDIVDISDKTNPTLISRISHQANFTHSVWTTPDLSHVVVTDEVDGLPARIWNIEDLDNPFEVSQFSANLQSLVHNPYVLDDLVFLSHNTEGLRVLDIADPALPVEVGYYDTFPGPSGGFNGLWSAYPYFPSGKIIGGNREDGLYIWRFNGTRAGRIYGIVADSVSGEPVVAAITIEETGRTVESAPDGSFGIGEVPSPVTGYTFVISAAGYTEKRIEEFTLNGGDSLWLDIRMVAPVTTVGEDLAPASTRLFQNYPNPFNGTSLIRFTLSASSHASLTVYDLLGREIAVLLDEELPAGMHVRRWNGSDTHGKPVGTGIYLYRLETYFGYEVRSMIFLK